MYLSEKFGILKAKRMVASTGYTQYRKVSGQSSDRKPRADATNLKKIQALRKFDASFPIPGGNEI